MTKSLSGSQNPTYPLDPLEGFSRGWVAKKILMVLGQSKFQISGRETPQDPLRSIYDSGTPSDPLAQWAAMRTYKNFKMRWIAYQTKILAFRSNNNWFFPLLNMQHINYNTFEMYHHDTRFLGFALFYLIKSTLTSYNFNGWWSFNVPGMPFESPECLLSCNIFKILELDPPLKIC